MPFDLSEITFDPDLTQNEPVTIIRTPIFYQAGGTLKKPFNVICTAIITVASSKELQMIPEGDRLTGALHMISATRIYTTSVDLTEPDPALQKKISDKIDWHGVMYSVYSVAPWRDFGFWEAILLRIEGA